MSENNNLNNSNINFSISDVCSQDYANALVRDYAFLKTLSNPVVDENGYVDEYHMYNLYYTLHQLTEKSLKFLMCLYLIQYNQNNESYLIQYNEIMRQREITCDKLKTVIRSNVSSKLQLCKDFLTALNKDVIIDDIKFSKEVRKAVNKVKDLQSVFKLHDLEIILRKLNPCIKEMQELEIVKPLTNEVPRTLYVVLISVYLVYRYSELPKEYTSEEFVNSLNLNVIINFNTEVVKLIDKLKQSSFNFQGEVALDRVGLDKYL